MGVTKGDKGTEKEEKKETVMYSNPVVLNSELHKDLKVAPVKDYKFAKNLNSSILTVAEFFEAAKFYPIVFSKTQNDDIMPVVILGVTDNAFADENGNWREGFYIPAFIRRYPFILSKTKEDDKNLLVIIDADYKGYDAEDGERLFDDDDGKYTSFLNRAIEFLKAYDAHVKLTKQFVEKLKELDLFSEIDANIKLNDGKSYVIRNLLIVNEGKMLSLDDDKLSELVRLDGKRGYMAWIYAHIVSLNNFVKIIKKQK